MSDYISQVIQLDTNNGRLAAIFTDGSKRLFDVEEVKPKEIKSGYRGFVPWGEDNDQPTTVLEKIRDDEVMASNMWFNICTAYGRGFVYTKSDGTPADDPMVKTFFKRNNMIRYWLEQLTDVKHFFFSCMLVILDREGKKIVKFKHLEAVNVRMETCNEKNGKIENIFYSNWADNPTDKNTDAYPLLDEDDPIGDMMIRLGKEPDPMTGKKNQPTKDRIFAIVNRIPTPGLKYYPFPYYYSTFNSGWATLKAMIPEAKIARLNNGMAIKYLVELHKDYFKSIFEAEGITDAAAKKARKVAEINNIKTFLSGHENMNKTWVSTYYVDPNGKEQRMVRIEVLQNQKEGGEFIDDSEEASNIVSYAMGVHPSLIGSSPGKNKNISGTEARELFTMKQALEKITRDLMLIPFEVLNDVNGWDLKFEIPDLLLTTLDQGTDAKVSNQQNEKEDDTKDA